MKKKIINAFMALILSFVFVFSFCHTDRFSNAANTLSENSIKTTISEVLSDYIKFDERIAGSEDEELASEYIKNFLDNQTNCVPIKNSFISNGIQSFKFTSAFDGNYYTSRNILYKIPAKNKTDKKVIIACSYDSVAYKLDTLENPSLVASQSVNQSAGSVSLLLALAKYLPINSFDFDIELIFFGASSSDNAGSKFYTDGISENDASNILLAINLDTISVGKNLYFYIDEVKTELSNLADKVFKANKTGIKEISLVNLGKVLLSNPNELGLEYTHIAQNSNNFNFMKVGVLTINILAGDYDSGINLGRNEYENIKPITFTADDNIDYIVSTYGEDKLYSNILNVYNSITSLISDSDFISVCESSLSQNNFFYTIFGNKDLVVWLTVIAFFIFVIIALITHYKLTVRAYDANIETEFVSSILNITANVDKKSQNDDIPKAISEIVAEDIKKDKRIKRKK